MCGHLHVRSVHRLDVDWTSGQDLNVSRMREDVLPYCLHIIWQFVKSEGDKIR